MTKAEELERITKKRVGRTMEALELAGSSETLKSAIKKQIWEFKKDIERNVLETGSQNAKEIHASNIPTND